MRSEEEIWKAIFGLEVRLSKIDKTEEPLAYVSVQTALYVLEWIMEDRTTLSDAVLQKCADVEGEIALSNYRRYEFRKWFGDNS